jgi:putative aldouronate transport system permease protein
MMQKAIAVIHRFNIFKSIGKRKNSYSSYLGKQTKDLGLMTLPGLLLVVVFSYLPMFGLVLAFKNFRYDKGILGSAWVGLKNFKFFFSSLDAWRVTRNAIGTNLIFIVSTLVVSVLLAFLLYEITHRMLLKVYQTAMFFPYFLSMAVVAYVGYSFFNVDLGLLNRILASFGIKPVMWYAEPELWVFILPIINLWKNIGYYVVIYYAGLMGIDSTYYESAAIDGANKIQATLKVSLPLLSPIIIIMVLLQIGKVFYSDFGLFYLVTKDTGILYSTTDVIDTYVFRALRVTGDIGVASAVGFYQSVVGFVLVFLSNWLVRKYDSDSALF